MKVLLVNKFHYYKGGSETSYFSLANGLGRLGHEVSFFSMKDEKNLPCAQSEYFIEQIDYNDEKSILNNIRNGISLLYSFEAKRKFEELLQLIQPDIVHLNLVHHQITMSILDAPSLRNIPVVYTAHDYSLICPAYTMIDGSGTVCGECKSGKFLSCITKKCIKNSRVKSVLAASEAFINKKRNSYERIDAVIAPSCYMREQLVEGGICEKKIIAMPNCISPEDYQGYARSFADKMESPYFVYFGRLSKEKGIRLVVDAFERANLPTWRLVIVGEGPEKNELEGEVDRRSLNGRIEFVGYKQGDCLKTIVAGAAFSITFPIWRETLSFSVIESMALGTPVVGSAIGGIPENIIEGRTGYLVSPRNVQQLTEIMKRSSRLDFEQYNSLQKECMKHVRQNCSQEEYINSVVALYQSLLSKHSDGME